MPTRVFSETQGSLKSSALHLLQVPEAWRECLFENVSLHKNETSTFTLKDILQRWLSPATLEQCDTKSRKDVHERRATMFLIGSHNEMAARALSYLWARASMMSF